MPTAVRPFTDDQVALANRVYGDHWFYYLGGTHPWRKYDESDAPTPDLIGKPIYEKPGPVHFLRFLNEVVYTLDEDDTEEPVKPFPRHKGYIKDYVEMVLFLQRFIVIPKSRRLMMTWVHAIYALWFALAHPRRNVVWQAQKGDKVADTMEAKILHVLMHLPQDRFAPFVDLNERKIPSGWDDRVVNYYKGKRESYGLTRVTFYSRITSPTGEAKLSPSSRIFGVPEGEDQTRQYTITLFIGDEFAFWKRPKASLKGIRPALGRNGQGILISSANPGYMEDLIERPVREAGEPEPAQPTEKREGVQSWYSKEGWFVYWIHYTADEDKRGVEWTQEPDMSKPVLPGDPGYARLGMSKRDWKQEMEIDFSVHQGQPFYPEYTDALHRQPVRAIPNHPLVLGFDFGLTPSTIIGQLTASGHFNILDEFISEENGISQHAELLSSYMDVTYPWWKKGRKRQYGDINSADFMGEELETQEMVISYVDPAGFQRAQTDMTTPIQILKQFGFNPIGAVQDPAKRMESVKGLLSKMYYYQARDMRLPALMINPRCKGLINALKGGAKQSKIPFRKEKNEHSHVTEALEYACVMLTSVEKRITAGKSRADNSAPYVQRAAR
jgi:hypothetical protein